MHSKDPSQHDDPPYPRDVENRPGHDSGLETAMQEKAPKDPNIVDWDGPDDPANPMNWPASKKLIAIGLVSFITMLS